MLAISGMRAFSLAAMRGSEGVSCDAHGAFAGGVPLLHPPSVGRPYWTPRPSAELNNELTARYRLPIDIASKAGGLGLIAAALNRGDLAMAAIATVQMQIPDPPPLAKLAESPSEIASRARELTRSGLLKFWDPALHPRAGVPPNPGWFAPATEGAEAAPVIPAAMRGDPSASPNSDWLTLVSDKPEILEPIPDVGMGNPEDKPGEKGPSGGEGENEVGPPGVIELPLPGGAPGVSDSRSGSPAPAGDKAGPKPLSAYGSTPATPSDQSLPPKIGSFPVPDNLTYGTTLFGNYAHDQTAKLLQEMYPDIGFKLRVGPGQRGIDVEVPDKSISDVGDKYIEIKPLTPSGESKFYRQLEEWGVGPVQTLTYDADGNVYYGFR